MAFFKKMRSGMSKSRNKLKESMNRVFFSGPDVDDDFWDNMEETLIESDMGAMAADEIVEEMRDTVKRRAIRSGDEIMEVLSEKIAAIFPEQEADPLDESPLCVLFVGVNGSGKTTTAGKLAFEASHNGRKVILGAADTFRAAAIEQLETWAERADVPIVKRDRGSDPASVCYETVEKAEQLGSDLILIDTAGRLHTSNDLMRELQKVCQVVRKRATCTVLTVLVIDATTGQNGLSQARAFNEALDLDAVIITKLDGTAKGGIAVAISHDLGLPILKIGVGEQLEDLQDFDALDYARALTGADGEGDDED
jgi:fused signal recognition particle receptor